MPRTATRPLRVTSEERTSEMARLYTEDGLTLAEVGQVYGVTRERVRQVLEAAGIGRRPRGSDGPPWYEADPRRAERALRDRRAGVRLAIVAEQAGVSMSLLQRFFHAVGEPRRRLPAPVHGMVRMYRRYGCRCDACRQANTVAHRHGARARYRQRRQLGLCIYCGKRKATDGTVGCKPCRWRARRRKK